MKKNKKNERATTDQPITTITHKAAHSLGAIPSCFFFYYNQ